MLKRKVMHYIKKWVDSKNKKCLVKCFTCILQDISFNVSLNFLSYSIISPRIPHL